MELDGIIDDTVSEFTETIKIQLTNPNYAHLQQNSFHIIKIIDDDTKIISSPLLSATEGSAYSYTVLVSDPHDIKTKDLTFIKKPDWLSVDNEKGQLLGTPGNDDVGDHLVSLKVSDAEGLNLNQEFIVSVSNVNQQPIIVSSPSSNVLEGSEYSYTIEIVDPDLADTININPITLPSWLNFKEEEVKLVGTPNNQDVGDHLIILNATIAKVYRMNKNLQSQLKM